MSFASTIVIKLKKKHEMHIQTIPDAAFWSKKLFALVKKYASEVR